MTMRRMLAAYGKPPAFSQSEAYHQAGHVAGICLGNPQRRLPPVHFQLDARPRAGDGLSPRLTKKGVPPALELQGGRLISDLPCCYRQATHRLKPAEQAKCLTAFEADIINLLCGPLAEAKYVALRDGEVFNANLVYLGALGFYGGKKDMALVGEYMACLVPDDEQMRQRKLAQLFLDAYEFINGAGHWQAVARLADGLYQSQQASYSCEELTALLELGGLPPPGAGAGGLHRAAGYGV